MLLKVFFCPQNQLAAEWSRAEEQTYQVNLDETNWETGNRKGFFFSSSSCLLSDCGLRFLILGWCFGSDSYQLERNVHLQEDQSPFSQPGGLLLSSLLVLLRIALLHSPPGRLLSRQQRRCRCDRDGPHSGRRAREGFAGEEWGAGSLTGREPEAGGGTGKIHYYL